jgi:hypothetical protein
MPQDQMMKNLHVKFRELGWIIAKKPEDDICPECNGISKEQQLANSFKTTKGGKPIVSAKQLAEQVFAKEAAQAAETADILSRHLSSAQPSKKASEESMAPVHIHTGMTPEHTDKFINALDKMSAMFSGLTSELSNI